MTIFDTGAASAEPVKPEALSSQEGWTKIESGQKPGSFRGDAVVMNTQIAVVLRKGAAGFEIHAKGVGGFALRTTLIPLGVEGPKISTVSVKTNESGEASVETGFGGDAAVSVLVKAGNAVVKTQSVKTVTGMRVEAPSRFGVLPDFFADDMVVDATKIPPDRAEVPSENFFMNMIPGGSSIVTTIWDKNERDVEITLSGEGEARVIRGVEAFYGKDGSIWAAILEGEGVWAMTELTAENAKNVVQFDWNVPFEAKWKVDFTRKDLTTDSWDLKLHLRNRSMWATGIGRYNYPAWSKWADKEKTKHVAEIQAPRGEFIGPVLAYPIDRVENTPLKSYTVVDLMQHSLGVGPCAYIMDVEGQKVHSKGLYTCAVFDQLAPLFSSGRQKDERHFVKKTLSEGLVFVTAIRRRIEDFCKFGEEMLVYLAEQKKANPEMEEFITKMETLTKNIDKHNARGVATPEGVGKWIADFHPDITADIPKSSGEGLVGNIRGVGGRQDDLVALCRMEVKILRQHAAVEMARNPKVAPVAKEIRERTQKILRGKFGHEGR